MGLPDESPGIMAAPLFWPPLTAAARVLKSSCDIGWVELWQERQVRDRIGATSREKEIELELTSWLWSARRRMTPAKTDDTRIHQRPSMSVPPLWMLCPAQTGCQARHAADIIPALIVVQAFLSVLGLNRAGGIGNL